jgi:hypothetical protein
MQNAVLWDMAQCGSCNNWRFEGTYGLHHQWKENQQARKTVAVTRSWSTLRRNTSLFPALFFLSPRWCRRCTPPKRRFLQESHGVTSQKTAFFQQERVRWWVHRKWKLLGWWKPAGNDPAIRHYAFQLNLLAVRCGQLYIVASSSLVLVHFYIKACNSKPHLYEQKRIFCFIRNHPTTHRGLFWCSEIAFAENHHIGIAEEFCFMPTRKPVRLGLVLEQMAVGI